MKKYMPLEGLRWSRDSGSTLCDTPQNGRSRTGWGVILTILISYIIIEVCIYVGNKIKKIPKVGKYII